MLNCVIFIHVEVKLCDFASNYPLQSIIFCIIHINTLRKKMEEIISKSGLYHIAQAVCLIGIYRAFSFFADDEPSEHYVLNRRQQELRMYVPTDQRVAEKEDAAGTDERREISEFLLNVGTKSLMGGGRKQRSGIQGDHSSGNPERLILLIRCIYLAIKAVRENGKNSPSDSTLLSTAERMVREELPLRSIPTSSVERYYRSV